jgi:hypothetical protein
MGDHENSTAAARDVVNEPVKGLLAFAREERGDLVEHKQTFVNLGVVHVPSAEVGEGAGDCDRNPILGLESLDAFANIDREVVLPQQRSCLLVASSRRGPPSPRAGSPP